MKIDEKSIFYSDLATPMEPTEKLDMYANDSTYRVCRYFKCLNIPGDNRCILLFCKYLQDIDRYRN